MRNELNFLFISNFSSRSLLSNTWLFSSFARFSWMFRQNRVIFRSSFLFFAEVLPLSTSSSFYKFSSSSVLYNDWLRNWKKKLVVCQKPRKKKGFDGELMLYSQFQLLRFDECFGRIPEFFVPVFFFCGSSTSSNFLFILKFFFLQCAVQRLIQKLKKKNVWKKKISYVCQKPWKKKAWWGRADAVLACLNMEE